MIPSDFGDGATRLRVAETHRAKGLSDFFEQRGVHIGRIRPAALSPAQVDAPFDVLFAKRLLGCEQIVLPTTDPQIVGRRLSAACARHDVVELEKSASFAAPALLVDKSGRRSSMRTSSSGKSLRRSWAIGGRST